MKLVSINIGRPMLMMRFGRQYSTAINKEPLAGPVALGTLGVEGDRQADSRNHGGVDKAVCCYAQEHYTFFAERLNEPELVVPAFGENFTTAGLLENEVCIGDTYAIGDAVVQVSQPREPCYKLAYKHHNKELIRWVHQTGFSGFYVRVLQPGVIEAGAAIDSLERPHPNMTVARTMAAVFSASPDRKDVASFSQAAELTSGWRERLVARQAKSDAEPEN